MSRQAPKNQPKSSPSRSRGQTIVIVALMFVMLIGFIGLVVDIGRVYIEWGQLRRAVDAASLAAAAQFREGRTISEMAAIARQMMEVNGVTPTEIIVDNCITEPSLCPTTPPRKFVRVTASSEVRTAFLPILGVDSFPITTSAVGEAASLDVVLVIDISESMAWDADMDDPMRDPHACNEADLSGVDGFPGECHPFEEVKAAADRFVQRVLDKNSAEEEDRLAIVTFANGWGADINQGTFYRPGGQNRTWITNRDQARQIIRDLRIFDPPECDWPDGSPKTLTGPCRKYVIEEGGGYGEYRGFECYSCRDAGDGWPDDNNGPPNEQEWSYYTTTNIGGSLLLAGNMFPHQKRDDALWVVILLTDGVANATFRHNSDNINRFDTYPVGSCPFAEEDSFFPICQDKNVGSRHPSSSTVYDADDYARDMADFVGCLGRNPADACPEDGGQGALAFSIGLGNGVLDNGCRDGHPEWCEVGPDGAPNTIDARAYGAELLRYVAAVGDDGDPATNDLCAGRPYNQSCGNYFFAQEGIELDHIFEEIASRIFTRLHQ